MSRLWRSPAAYAMSWVSKTPDLGARAFSTVTGEQADSIRKPSRQRSMAGSLSDQALGPAEHATQLHTLGGDDAQAGVGTDHDRGLIVIAHRFGQVAGGGA